MKKKPSDRHLDAPSESNRDKHINFLALENNENDPADEPSNGALAAENNRHNGPEKKQYKYKQRRNPDELIF